MKETYFIKKNMKFEYSNLNWKKQKQKQNKTSYPYDVLTWRLTHILREHGAPCTWTAPNNRHLLPRNTAHERRAPDPKPEARRRHSAHGSRLMTSLGRLLWPALTLTLTLAHPIGKRKPRCAHRNRTLSSL